MGRERERVDAQAVDVEPEEAGGLHRVGVHRHPARPDQPRDLGHGLDRADLIVGEHDADEARVGPDRGRDRGRLDDAARIDRYVGDVDAEVLLQIARRPQHRAVLDGRRDEVPLVPSRQRHPLERQVVGLRATAGEDDLVVVAVERPRHPGPGCLERLGGTPAGPVEVRGIPELLAQVRLHRLQHYGVHGGRRRIVEIDGPGGGYHRGSLTRRRAPG